jgi:hypothetical protein
MVLEEVSLPASIAHIAAQGGFFAMHCADVRFLQMWLAL